MAAAAVARVMPEEETKALHPFFKQGNGTRECRSKLLNMSLTRIEVVTASVLPDQSGPNSKTEDQVATKCDPTFEDEEILVPKAVKGKGRSTRKSGAIDKAQQTLSAIVKPSDNAEGASTGDGPSDAAEVVSQEQDTDTTRRKRRRTSQDEDIEVGAEAPIAVEATPPNSSTHKPDGKRHNSSHVLVPASSPLRNDQGSQRRSATKVTEPPMAERTPPKKVLRLNAKGTFGSTPPKKDDKVKEAAQNTDDEGAPNGKRKRRPRKSKEKAQAKQKLVSLPYHENEPRREEMGETIDRILAGTFTVKPTTPPPKKSTSKKQRTPQKPKATHPFFTGKANEKPEPRKPESPRKFSATTPGKLRGQVNRDRMLGSKMVDPSEAQYPVGSALLKDRLMVKHLGACEPAWPSREQVHVRGIDQVESGSTQYPKPVSDDGQRKGKNAQLPFPANESILGEFGSSLKPEVDQRVGDDGFLEPHHQLRVPHKLLLPGESIRQRISGELSGVFDDMMDELAAPSSSQGAPYGAPKRLYRNLPSTFSAFDESRGEAQSWAHKYAPSAADEVLGGHREAVILRDWLKALTVTAVEGAVVPSEKKAAARSEPKPRKKRRKQDDGMDDFLVEDADDPRAMDELSEPEDISADATVKKYQRSIVQTADGTAKLNNAVVLSGPHGCGKTVAVYAVAKELGFKVFEISSCDRRSGRDVLERVGDMTENHLVKHHGVDTGEVSATEDNKAFEEQFRKDLESGRQGKMNAFFKPEAGVKPPSKKKAPSTTRVLEALKQEVKKPAKEQQQSLILLEEVDVLFRDDKEFWATVFKLITSSKRPFIMTCNDEHLVPSQAMSLHAILRFAPPPAVVAIDYLLLIAASEGHLLKRQAVSSLYRSKHHDLRASISELDFWCRMGIGDPREGLGWIYQRWPPGSDVDEHGRKLRLVSEDTYHAGMGLFNEDDLSEEDHLMHAWREFGISPFDLPTSDTLSASDCLSQSAESKRPFSRAFGLKRFTALADSLSATDTFTAPGLPASAPLDTTQPDITDKVRASYTEGLQLLQTDSQTSLDTLTASLATTSTLLAHHTLGLDQPPARPPTSPCTLLDRLTHPDPTPNPLHPLTRAAFSPFDPLTYPTDPSTTTTTTTTLVQSVLDGPFKTLVTDLAPYIRSIARHDLRIESQRAVLGKRARNTRAARSAVEGGVGDRSSVRRAKWWDERSGIELGKVVETGGEGWEGVVREVMSAQRSREGSEESVEGMVVE